MANQRQRAKDLIELAVDDGTPEKERLAAALKAVGLIHKYDLLASPLDDLLGSKNETVRAVSTVVERATDPDFLGALKTIGGQIAAARRGGRGDGEPQGRRRRRSRR